MPSQKSLIKPHFVNLTSSEKQLPGLVAERDVEQSKEEYRGLAVEPNKHILVLHNNNRNKLEWKLEGKKQEEQFVKDDLIINPAGLNVNPHWNSDVELLVLAIKPDFVEFVSESVDRPANVGLFPQFKFQDRFIKLMMKNLVHEFENKAKPDLVYAESLTYGLVTHVIRNYSRDGYFSQPVEDNGLPIIKLSQTIEYINENIGNGLTLESIARIAGFSPSYFITLFKNSTGLTPHQYIIKRKADIAKRALLESKKSITEIALDVGFADQSHLTRVMRKQTGLTPGNLRSN